MCIFFPLGKGKAICIGYWNTNYVNYHSRMSEGGISIYFNTLDLAKSLADRSI